MALEESLSAISPSELYGSVVDIMDAELTKDQAPGTITKADLLDMSKDLARYSPPLTMAVATARLQLDVLTQDSDEVKNAFTAGMLCAYIALAELTAE